LSPDQEVLIRGDEAARARPVDLLSRASAGALTNAGLNPVGPWAQEAQKIQDSARTEGFELGRHEGHAIGRREGREQSMAQLRSTVEATLTQIDQRSEDLCHRMATDAVNLALEIASAVIGRELATTDDPGADAIARCLDVAPTSGDLVARLNPGDAACLGDLLALADRRLEVVPDERLESGSAIVTIDETTIDARIATAMERVTEVLR
jgi:flagellar assembly protein FliH